MSSGGVTRPRRSHRKSRTGCSQCKRRRVKCDEREPRCTNCTRHGIQCEFTLRKLAADASLASAENLTRAAAAAGSGSSAEFSPMGWDLHARTPGSDASADRGGGGGGRPPSTNMAPIYGTAPVTPGAGQYTFQRPGGVFGEGGGPQAGSGGGQVMTGLGFGIMSGFSIQDLELMHHFTIDTCFTLTNHRKLQLLWQKVVPLEAFTHEFLLRGILAIAALHLSTLRPAQKEPYAFLALTYQNMSITLAHSAIREVDSSNCNAIFMFSSLIIVFAFASPRFQESLIVVEQTREVAEWVSLIRAVTSILRPHLQTIQSGRLAPMLSLGPEPDAQLITEETGARLEELQRLCESAAADPDERAAYVEAMTILKSTYIDALPITNQGYPIAVLFIWPAIVPDAYIACLRNRRQPALVILAHYCTMLHLLDDYWWMKGRAYLSVRNVYTHLDDSWRPHIAWPLSVVGVSNPAYVPDLPDHLNPQQQQQQQQPAGPTSTPSTNPLGGLTVPGQGKEPASCPPSAPSAADQTKSRSAMDQQRPPSASAARPNISSAL